MHAPLLALSLVLGALTTEPRLATVDSEGPLRNSTPLPSQRSATDAFERGDQAWLEALAAEDRERASRRTVAFDAWRDALALSVPGDGVRLMIRSGATAPFPDPGGTHGRRGEGIAEAVIRRLVSLEDADRRAWETRFGSLSRAATETAFSALNRGTTSVEDAAEGLRRVEREFPLTKEAALAAVALFELALEAGRPSGAAAWLLRARRHLRHTPSWTNAERARLRAGLERRSALLTQVLSEAAGVDHTAPQPVSPPLDSSGERDPRQESASTAPRIRPVGVQRLSGLNRRSDEPFGLGLASGIAFFSNGAALVQGAHGLLSIIPTEDGRGLSLGTSGAVRSLYEELFGIRQPIARVAPSAGGWPSLPATDGQRMALVMGRGEPARTVGDIEIPPTGNALGVVTQGPSARPLEPAWVLRDGIVAHRPSGKSRRSGQDDEASIRSLTPSRDTVMEDGGALPSWNLGRGWEFQPGPVMADGAVFILARGLGNPTAGDGEEDRADEIRLCAMDAETAALRWSVSVTKERGLLSGGQRGQAGYYATTTMPLALDRPSGTLLVGTNSGLLAAYGIAEGRLLWAFQNQRRTAQEPGWPGSRAPLLVNGSAWFAPFDSSFAYALPAGPAPPDGSLLVEPPRQRGSATDLVAVLPGTESESELVLLGRHGRHGAVILATPDGVRRPAAYLSPDEGFGGRAALDPSGSFLWVSGTMELSGLSRASDFRLVAAAPLPSQGAGRGGEVVLNRDFLYVVGRDTVWVYGLL